MGTNPREGHETRPIPCGLAHPFNFQSAYGIRPEGELEATNVLEFILLLNFLQFEQSFTRCIDYIWFTPKLTARSVLQPYPRSFYEQFEALPNPRFPSDHISLWCDLSFTK